MHARCGFIINTLRKKTSTCAVRKDDEYCALCSSTAAAVACYWPTSTPAESLLISSLKPKLHYTDLLWICCTTVNNSTGLWTSVIFVRIDLYNTTITVDCKSAAKKLFSQYHAWIDRYDKGLCLSVLGVARSPLAGSKWYLLRIQDFHRSLNCMLYNLFSEIRNTGILHDF